MARSTQVIGILILNQNGEGWLPMIYDSILAQGYEQVRVYLVDNASTDRSVDLTIERYPEVTVMRMPKNLGYCMAYNLAMPQAFADGCDWVVWANNDVRLEPGCLEQLVSVGTKDHRIGILGPAFLGWESDEPNYYMVGNHPLALDSTIAKSGELFDVEWVEGSFLMLSRQCFKSVGNLDPYLFFYWEETDFCRRARYKGWRVVLVSRALARHYAGGWSVAHNRNKARAEELKSRNFYIYQLANPFEGFYKNFLAAFHLFLVYAKQHLTRDPSMVWFHAQTFSKVLGDLWTIYKKWFRDRRGVNPPKTVESFRSVKVKVLRGRA